ncbi:MAG: ABC transporter permease, partial [Acidobacteriota bacterium]
MQGLWHDLRYGARMLLKTPAFTLVAILMLALGIGANTAIFSVVNAALLRPLAFKEPEQLVMVFSQMSGGTRGSVAYPDLLDWRSQTQSFSQLSAVTPQSVNLTGRAEPGRVLGGFISADFFQTLGVQPALGRAFQAGEDAAGAERVVILNHTVWRDRFGANPGLIGQTLTLNGQLYTVVGIMPEGFHFPYSDIDIWMPVQQHPGFSLNRQSAAVEVIGRLRPGVTGQQARAEMETIAARLAQQYPETNKDRGITLINLQSMVVERLQPLLVMLLGAVGFVLLIACANVANLTLSRAIGRSRELALRAALGASRFRLLQRLLTESLLLSFAGGLLGLLIGSWGMDALAASSGVTLPFGVKVKFDPMVFAFTFGVTALTGVLFGLLPALRFSRPDVNDALKEGGRSSAANSRSNPLRSALAVVQVGLA